MYKFLSATAWHLIFRLNELRSFLPTSWILFSAREYAATIFQRAAIIALFIQVLHVRISFQDESSKHVTWCTDVHLRNSTILIHYFTISVWMVVLYFVPPAQITLYISHLITTKSVLHKLDVSALRAIITRYYDQWKAECRSSDSKWTANDNEAASVAKA